MLRATTAATLSTRVALLLCVLAALVAPAFAQEPPLEELTVAQVRVVAEDGTVLSENPADLPLQPGQGYTAEAVRASIQHLHGSGRFAEIRAEATRADGALRLDFVVRENFYVNQVRVAGLKPPPSEARAEGALRLQLGENFRESLLEEALERLRETLRQDGLYQAQLEAELSPRAETRQMDITVRVTPGPRAQLGTLELRNETDFADAELRRRAELRPGQEVTTQRFDRAAARIRDFLADRGHLSARATLRRGEFDPQSNTVPVALEVAAGPRVRVEVEGAKISRGTLRQLLPIYQEAAVDRDLLEEGRRDIRDYLEGQGYFDSQVTYTTEQEADNGHLVITYHIERGARRRLVGVAFEGNRQFGDELLHSRLRIRPAGFLDRGRFSQRLLRADEASLRGLYIANGYQDVEVRAEVVQDYLGSEEDLFVRFHITEGPLTRIAELEIIGNETLDDELLLARIETLPNQPYSEYNVALARNQILALYFSEGFPQARFTYEAEETDDPNLVRLTYRIEEGQQFTVERVLLDGYDHTRRGVIAREVQVQPGDPLSEQQQAETQRRLYNLGIFSRVSIAPQNPQGSDPTKPVVVLVEEADRYTMAYGGGIEIQRLGSGGDDPTEGEFRVSPRVLFEIAKANVGGRAHTLSFKARASTLQGRALVSYIAPNFLANPSLSLLFTGFGDRTSDVRTFSSTRYEASAQLIQQVSRITTLLYRYSFRRVLVDADSLRVPPEEIPLFSQPTRISAVGASWVRDRRLDARRSQNPSDPVQGDFNTLDLSMAVESFGSSASFVRLFYQNSTFHPIAGRHRRIVFARSLRIGIQEPLGDTLETDIPLPERFFAGGGTSLRGFGLNQAGPRNPTTGFPVGGLALLVFNHELRFPMLVPVPFVDTEGKLGGAVFYDAGNVFSRANRITFRTTPASPTDINYFSHTVGFGFRYQTPIGPVRLDLGYLLNPATFEFCSASGTVADPRCPEGEAVQRTKLSRFQFFFNIGSIF